MSEPTTPLMRQYQAIKTRYPHALVLFRLGDFYELFHEDAIVASRELQITLTSRNREKGKPIPMCGVPYHAAENYIARLIRGGFKVAICEQMELPAPGKKLVRREVTRVITPGTATDAQLLEPGENNFLAAVSYAPNNGGIGLAWVDISTGEFSATEFSGGDAENKLRDEISTFAAARNSAGASDRPICRFRNDRAGNEIRFAHGNSRWRDHSFGRLDLQSRLRRTHVDGTIRRSGPGRLRTGRSSRRGNCRWSNRSLFARNFRDGNGTKSTGHALRHLDRIRYYEQQDALGIDGVSVRNLELVTPLFPDDAASAHPTTLLAALTKPSRPWARDYFAHGFCARKFQWTKSKSDWTPSMR